jgi:hypothetical protein
VPGARGQRQREHDVVGIGGLTLETCIVTDGQDFVSASDADWRKLKAKHLEPTKDDGVSTIDGRSVADPGFLTALQKISKSYNRNDGKSSRKSPITEGYARLGRRRVLFDLEREG